MRALYFTIVIILSVGCDSGIPLESPDSKSKYIVESYLASGDSVRVRVSQSYDYYTRSRDGGVGTDSLFSRPSVTLSYNNMSYNLTRSYQEVYPYKSTYYTLPKSIFTVPNEGKLVLHIGETFGKGEATAESILPEKVSIASFKIFFEPKDVSAGFFDTTTHSSYFDTVQGYRPAKISISGNFFRGFYGLIKLQKEYFFQSQAYPSTYVSEIIANSNGSKDISVESKNLTGGTRDTSGTWTLSLISIDKFYYDFYHASQSQEDGAVDLGPLFFDAVEIPSNIKGGLGIFTTMAVDTMSVVIP